MANRSFEVAFTGWVASNPVIYRSDPTQPDRAVACFRAMHTPRYRDPSGQWRDGESMRVTVKCWGWAAQYVHRSIHLGDPIVAIGRLNRTRWIDNEGSEHFGMELTASSLGHDLTLGESKFIRMRAGKPKENVTGGEINPATGEIYAEDLDKSVYSGGKGKDSAETSDTTDIDYVLSAEDAGVPVV